MTQKAGILNEKPSLLLYDYETLCCSSAIDKIKIPEKFMLPEDRIPTCRNQGTTGQCAAFATAGILEILNYLETGERRLFSTTYIYGRHRKSSLRTVEGMFVSSLMKHLTLLGSIPNDMMPQIWENPNAYDLVHNSNLKELDEIAQKTHIATYIKLKDKHGNIDKSIQNIKAALFEYSIPVFGDIKMDGAGHAICIVGWDKNYIYYMNSWGTSYGDKGICKFKPEKLRDAYLLLDAKNAPVFPFVDVPEDHWAYHAISRCYGAGIINGIDATHFAPDNVLTKAQVSQALYNLVHKYSDFNGVNFVDAKDTIAFSDVNKKQWFYKAINYCVNKKIFLEKNGEFAPDACVTRGEFCRIVHAYINGHCDTKKISKELAKIKCNSMPFIDVLKGEKIYEDILVCYALGIINGIDDTHFMPNGLLSRAHLCQMIYKLIKIIEEIEA
jgi:hypothetical protein